MAKTPCAAALVLACAAGPGRADDSGKQPKTPWDIAFGAALMSDYNFRGISASDHRPAASAWFEPRYDFSRSLQAYLNVTTNSLVLPNQAPTAVEIYAGARPTFDRLALDFGIWEHWLPGVRCFNFRAPGGRCVPELTVLHVNSVPKQLSYWEVFGKATYHVDRQLSFGGRLVWTPSVLNSGDEATYVAGWAKYVLPPVLPRDFGWFISAEAGHWFRNGSPYPSYTNWNAGLAFTWKQFTLDLRYSQADRRDCDVAVAALEHTSNRCGASFVARLAVDLTKANLAISGDGADKQGQAGKQAKAADQQAGAGRQAKTDQQAGAGRQAKADQPATAGRQAKTGQPKADQQQAKAGKEAGKDAKPDQQGKDKQVTTPWDIAFGGALMSNYNFRGISASDHRPAVSASFEPRYDFSRSLQAYLSVTTNSITLANRAAAAVEILAGVRPTFDRLALDFAFWEHWLPGGRCFDFQAAGGRCTGTTVLHVNSVPAELSYWEIFGKATYYVDRQLSFSGRVAWTPSVLNSGDEATYTAGTVKYILPRILPKDFGWFVSAEAGHWFRGGSPYPSYSNWNAGLAFTWTQFTLDLRYSDTNRHDCEVPVIALDHTSNRCGASFVARLAFDLTKKNLK